MREDDGYKLHIGALAPGYVETTMSDGTFSAILDGLYDEVREDVKAGIRLHRESCLELGYTGAFLGAQLDLTPLDTYEYVTFSVSYVAEGETDITRIGLAARAFHESHTAADIEPWIEEASVET